MITVVERSNARAVLVASGHTGVPVLVPAAVLAETVFGDGRDARANQVVKKLQVVPLTEPIARSAAGLKRLARMTGVMAAIDAIVVATSAAVGGGVVLTSDIHDIRVLANCASSVRIRPVRV
jgi:predicted nucleic acid-binding protein